MARTEAKYFPLCQLCHLTGKAMSENDASAAANRHAQVRGHTGQTSIALESTRLRVTRRFKLSLENTSNPF